MFSTIGQQIKKERRSILRKLFHLKILPWSRLELNWGSRSSDSFLLSVKNFIRQIFDLTCKSLFSTVQKLNWLKCAFGSHVHLAVSRRSKACMQSLKPPAYQLKRKNHRPMSQSNQNVLLFYDLSCILQSDLKHIKRQPLFTRWNTSSNFMPTVTFSLYSAETLRTRTMCCIFSHRKLFSKDQHGCRVASTSEWQSASKSTGGSRRRSTWNHSSSRQNWRSLSPKRGHTDRKLETLKRPCRVRGSTWKLEGCLEEVKSLSFIMRSIIRRTEDREWSWKRFSMLPAIKRGIEARRRRRSRVMLSCAGASLTIVSSQFILVIGDDN